MWNPWRWIQYIIFPTNYYLWRWQVRPDEYYAWKNPPTNAS